MTSIRCRWHYQHAGNIGVIEAIDFHIWELRDIGAHGDADKVAIRAAYE